MMAATKTASGTDDARKLCDDAWRRFEASMDDDFGTRSAIAAMYDLARDANKLLSDAKLSRKGASSVVEVLSKFNSIFDVLQDGAARKTVAESDARIDLIDPESMTGSQLSEDEITMWLKRREAARKKKDFEYADRVRKKLAELGIEIQDAKDGATWTRR